MSKLKRLFKYLLEKDKQYWINFGNRVFYMFWIPCVIFSFVMIFSVFLEVLPKI